jgi:hypothetical protein
LWVEECSRCDIQRLSGRVAELQEKVELREKVDRLSTPVSDFELEQKFESLKQKHESLEKRYLYNESYLQHRVIMLRTEVILLQKEVKMLSALGADFAEIEKLAHDAYIASSDAAQQALMEVDRVVPLDMPHEVVFNQLPTMRDAREQFMARRRN